MLTNVLSLIDASPELAMRASVDLAMALERNPLPAFVLEDTPDDPLEVADRLPRDRARVLRDILEANGIRDHDSAQADERYAAWKRNRRKGPRPRSNLGGMLDGFDCAKDRKAPCCLLEAFERDTRNVRGWRDLGPVLAVVAEAIGVDHLHLPDDVLERHIAEDAEVTYT